MRKATEILSTMHNLTHNPPLASHVKKRDEKYIYIYFLVGQCGAKGKLHSLVNRKKPQDNYTITNYNSIRVNA